MVLQPYIGEGFGIMPTETTEDILNDAAHAVGMSPSSDPRQSLIKAFETFQRQCEVLEASHRELQERLRSSEVELARKNTELAAKINEVEAVKERLQATVESIADAVFLVKGGVVELSNNAAARLIEEGFSIALDGPYKAIAGIVADARPVSDADITLRINDDERFFMVSIVPLVGYGSLGGIVLSMKDVTEHRRLQKRLESEERLAAVGRVAASVAHEIRNPLSGIEGFATLLARDLKDSPQQLRLAERTVAASRRLSQVVTSLLNYTREFKCSLARHDINALINGVVELVRPHTESKAEIRTSLCDGPLSLMLDKTLMEQAISNLVMNAIDACVASDRRGVVEIKTSRGDGHAEISVADNGCGMAPAELKRIFEPFFTTKAGGVGLGLALCERIVKAHGGDIKAQSQKGLGSRFTIRICSPA